jgi:hypothetical protein
MATPSGWPGSTPPTPVRALVEVVNQNDDLGAKVKAAESILNRGFGRPDQHTTVDATLTQEMPWLSARRLMYQESMRLAQDIDARPLPKPENGGADPK